MYIRMRTLIENSYSCYICIYIYSHISVRIYVHVDTISIFTYVHKRIDGKREAET